MAGLGFLLLLTLQFVRGMRRLVRVALQDQAPLALPDGRKIAAPSDAVILDTLRPLWLLSRWTAGRPWYQWGRVTPPVPRILDALDLALSVRFEPSG